MMTTINYVATTITTILIVHNNNNNDENTHNERDGISDDDGINKTANFKLARIVHKRKSLLTEFSI